MEEDQIYFEDAMAQTSGYGDAQDFKALVLSQMSRINNNGSQEMRGGYYESVATKKGLIRRYVPDARSVYIASVKTFYDLLACRFSEDEKQKEDIQTTIQKDYDNWEKELTDVEASYSKASKELDTKERDVLRNQHMTSMVEHYRKLYAVLGGFCSRQDYFGEIKGRGR